jgi:hypothetical protein
MMYVAKAKELKKSKAKEIKKIKKFWSVTL